MIQLREYQAKAVRAVEDVFVERDAAALLVAPTGSGKTILFTFLADQWSRQGQNVLILVHRKELLNQTSKTLRQFGVRHGLIFAGMPPQRSMERVQVASVQTLVKRMQYIKFVPQVIVIDESHHAIGKSTWGKVLDYYPPTRILGVTATPARLDGQGLGVDSGGFFKTLIQGPTVRELIDAGHLSQPVIYAPPQQVDLSGLHTRAGDFARDEAAEAMDKPKITGDAVEHYRRHADREPAIAFCASIAHAEHVADAFRQAGYAAASIDGKMDDATRATRITDLGNGQLNVLTSCEIVSEGTDIPIVSAAVLLRPTQSLALYLQQGGRVLRPFQGKTHSTILDHVGNCYRHGLLDDERQWSLDAPKRKKSDPAQCPVRQCDECYFVHKPAPTCPACGYTYPVQSRKIKQVAGTLEEVERAEAPVAKAPLPLGVMPDTLKQATSKARTLDDLRAVGKHFGCRPGWSEYVYRSRVRNGSHRRKA